MLRNYLITAFRTLNRNRTYAILNIAGLAIGITACIVIFLLVRYKLSFDNFHTHKDHIYRVVTENHQSTGTSYTAGVPYPLPDAFRTDFPQLEAVASIFNFQNGQITITGKNDEKKRFKEDEGLFFADPSFFNIFDFVWINGNPQQALGAPNTIVLTQETADRYFGNWQDAIGQTIRIDWDTVETLKVTGILQNPPANTDFQFKALVSSKNLATYFKTIGEEKDWGSTRSNFQCYIVLPPQMAESQFEKLLPAFNKKYKDAEEASLSHQTIQPLKDVFLDERFENYSEQSASRKSLLTLALIGVFLIVTACINFINLATAQAVRRSREVGVRKVLGGNRPQLIGQFLSETTLITLLATVLSGVLIFLVLPGLNQFLDTHLRFAPFTDWRILVFLIVLIGVVSVGSGFYPALVLSGFQPILALKSKITTAAVGGLSLRRSLVVTQFVISQVFLIATLVAVQQMDFFRTAPMGFNREAILTVPIPEPNVAKQAPLRNRLSKIKGVSEVSLSFATPASSWVWSTSFRFANEAKNAPFSVQMKAADTSYFHIYNLKLVAGRIFQPGDSARDFVVNETFLKKAGIRNPEEAIGRQIVLMDGPPKQIVGVVKDFHAQSFRDPIKPCVLFPRNNTYNLANLKVSSQNLPQTIEEIRQEWLAVYPEFVFEHEFLDDKIAEFYESEQQLSQLFQAFAGIAVFISCLGLYGLVSFMATQRTKEVGIRKVLGASVSQIVLLFSKEFIRLVCLAFVIATPIAWLIMNQWLQDFEYKISLGANVFLFAGLLTLLIAFLTVSYQSIKAAIANPVKALKSE